MKRWLTHAVIATYLGALSWGIAAHALNVGVSSHTAMYFVVWDMFCGWSSHSTRMHVVGEGVSGKRYDLTRGPWGELKPYGELGRSQYDFNGAFAPYIARNVLRHTDHEPMARIYLVEEAWPKMYNLSDRIWQQRVGEVKHEHHYYTTVGVLNGDGVRLSRKPGWVFTQNVLALQDNPRLQADSSRNQPFLAVSPGAAQSPGGGFANAGLPSPIGNRYGN